MAFSLSLFRFTFATIHFSHATHFFFRWKPNPFERRGCRKEEKTKQSVSNALVRQLRPVLDPPLLFCPLLGSTCGPAVFCFPDRRCSATPSHLLVAFDNIAFKEAHCFIFSSLFSGLFSAHLYSLFFSKKAGEYKYETKI